MGEVVSNEELIMKAICKDNTYTFRNRLTVGKEYDVITSFKDPYAGYLMLEIRSDDKEKRVYRADRFKLITE